jgi:outer membrane protein assembly factor BamB
VLSYGGGFSSGSGLTYANGVVYAGGSLGDVDGIAYAVDAKIGKLLHTFDTGRGEPIWSAPSVANGILYLRTMYTIQAFNISTGAHLWTVKHGGSPSSDSGVTNSNNLAIYSENLTRYSGGKTQYYNELYALNAQTGAQKWVVQGTAGPFITNIAVANGVIYAKGSDVTAYHETTGKVIWTVPAGPSSSPSEGIAVANGVVFSVQWNISGGSTLLLALNANTGKKLWSYTDKSGLIFCPIVANGMVYIGDAYDLLAFARS